MRDNRDDTPRHPVGTKKPFCWVLLVIFCDNILRDPKHSCDVRGLLGPQFPDANAYVKGECGTKAVWVLRWQTEWQHGHLSHHGHCRQDGMGLLVLFSLGSFKTTWTTLVGQDGNQSSVVSYLSQGPSVDNKGKMKTGQTHDAFFRSSQVEITLVQGVPLHWCVFYLYGNPDLISMNLWVSLDRLLTSTAVGGNEITTTTTYTTITFFFWPGSLAASFGAPLSSFHSCWSQQSYRKEAELSHEDVTPHWCELLNICYRNSHPLVVREMFSLWL